MLEQITSAELSELQAYYRLEPFEEQRADFRIALVCSVLQNIALSVWGKKGAKMTSPSDFMPQWWGDDEDASYGTPEVQTVEEQKSILLSIARFFGIKKKK